MRGGGGKALLRTPFSGRIFTNGVKALPPPWILAADARSRNLFWIFYTNRQPIFLKTISAYSKSTVLIFRTLIIFASWTQSLTMLMATSRFIILLAFFLHGNN